MSVIAWLTVVAVTWCFAAGTGWAQDAPKLDFKKEAEVEKLLGPPTAKIVEPERVIWLYDKPVKNVFGKMEYPELRFVKGEVRSIQWLSRDRMAERLKDANR